MTTPFSIVLSDTVSGDVAPILATCNAGLSVRTLPAAGAVPNRVDPSTDVVFVDAGDWLCCDEGDHRIHAEGRNPDRGPAVVVIADDDAYALSCIRACGADYLIRPLTPQSVCRALRRARQLTWQTRLCQFVKQGFAPAPFQFTLDPDSGGAPDLNTGRLRDETPLVGVSTRPSGGSLTPGPASSSDGAAAPTPLRPGDTPVSQPPPRQTSVPDPSGSADKIVETGTDRIMVRCRGGIQLIPVEDILHIDADGSYVEIVTRDQTYLVRSSLSKLEEMLPGNFFRIHRSHTVNLDEVERLAQFKRGEYVVCMHNGKRLKMSRHRLSELEERIGAVM